ncbi:MAG TPA: DNA-directed RNA polymerase subunit beta [Chthonomonadales bacterium]|nr:DNA-directed RNA polymerase subunit beta [Chthonomonadales bacterium]
MKEIQHASKRTSHVVDIPNLIELQLDSYRWFLEEGLPELFQSFSPIYDFTGSTSISLVDFSLGQPKYTVEDCRDRDMTFEAPIKARVELTQSNKETIESEVYLGDLPLMTDKGTFIINGAERVVVSQLARSPGVYFKDHLDLSGRMLYFATLIPSEGAWVDIETESNDVVTVKIGQTRKLPLTTLLRALDSFRQAQVPVEMTVRQARTSLWVYTSHEAEGRIESEPTALAQMALAAPIVDRGTGEILFDEGTRIVDTIAQREAEEARDSANRWVSLEEIDKAYGRRYMLRLRSPVSTTEDLIRLFSPRVVLENPEVDVLIGTRPAVDIEDPNTGKVVAKAFQKIDKAVATAIARLNLAAVDVYAPHRYIEATIEADVATDRDSALLDIYRKIRPGDPVTVDSARNLLQSIFYDSRRYDLAKVGRYKMNRKLGAPLPLTARTLTREDLVSILRYVINLAEGVGSTDDIDHLENKRVRSVGELLYSQLRMGFLRMEKVAKERMTSLDSDSIIPQVILSVKPISAAIKSFFGSSQLSQFMDQTNPLAELTSKRRLSALGPGGLSRQSAKLEVRDVHHSHYGRICPIETPEGPNIGLIGSMAIHARVDPYGFLETPYRVVKKGVVTTEIAWMTADTDHRYRIAPGNEPLDERGSFIKPQIQVRHEDEYPIVKPEQVEYMDVSPMQIVSVATAMIPFLENDDANRALMGSNMQRQAVPTLRPDAPLVKTGVERRAARDSGAVILARRSGTVRRVTAEQIEVELPDGRVDTYRLINMLRSNQSTCITQRPIVDRGQRVRQGQVLADGPCTDHGELALGKNVLVAFMPWGGYNYEDAILVSERLVKDDVFTSIHIEKYEKEARDTKLGPEEITRDIPNVGEDMLKDLDENGIVRIGAEVRPEDILVGEVAPKGQGELTAEERLIIAIFGKKAEETRDVSLRVPHGEKGKVVDVKVFSRFKYQCVRCKTEFNFSKRPDRLQGERYKSSLTGRQSDDLGRRADGVPCERCDGDLVRRQSDELSAGVNQLVRVYIAQKRKLMEGDKMAGRHGNKGVISKILAEEDMPFLPDGTPVDIVLNPLGVPSRMNIGQILETHLGLVGHHLGCTFVNPAFEGSTEKEILGELDRLAAHLRRRTLTNYLNSELQMGMEFAPTATPEQMLEQIEAELRTYDGHRLERVSRVVAGPPVSPVVQLEMDRTNAEEPTQPAEEDEPPPLEAVDPPADFDYAALVERIQANAWTRAGVDPTSGKCRLRDGMTGHEFNHPITLGYIYMMKLAHLVDDKIHARSTGPYSLVTQQPLGGKAQFGGQRFGEMEVWALEAYGSAYTLQEILTIKSDDVQGRVKTYEAIVKGDNMLEPGIPESFKILVNELQSLGLRVVVEDNANREIDLKDRDDDIDPHEDPVKAAARRRARRLGAAGFAMDEPVF